GARIVDLRAATDGPVPGDAGDVPVDGEPAAGTGGDNAGRVANEIVPVPVMACYPEWCSRHVRGNSSRQRVVVSIPLRVGASGRARRARSGSEPLHSLRMTGGFADERNEEAR